MKTLNLEHSELLTLTEFDNILNLEKIKPNSRKGTGKKEIQQNWFHKSIDLLESGTNYINKFFKKEFLNDKSTTLLKQLDSNKEGINDLDFFCTTKENKVNFEAYKSSDKEFSHFFAILILILMETNELKSDLYYKISTHLKSDLNDESKMYTYLLHDEFFERSFAHYKIISEYIDNDLSNRVSIENFDAYKKLSKKFFKLVFLNQLFLLDKITEYDTFSKALESKLSYFKDLEYPFPKLIKFDIENEEDFDSLEEIYIFMTNIQSGYLIENLNTTTKYIDSVIEDVNEISSLRFIKQS